MERGTTFAFFLVFLVIGLYLINSTLNFIKIPASVVPFIEQIDKWISLVGGFLLVIGGFYFLKAAGRKKKSE